MEICYPTIFSALSWLPWFLACLETHVQTRDSRSARNAGFALSLLTLAGSPQIFLGAVYLGFFYFLSRGGFAGQINNGPVSFRGMTRSFVSFLWGFTPGLLAWIPFYDFARFSDRMLSKPDYVSFTGLSLSPGDWYRFMFPLRPVGFALNGSLPEKAIFSTETYLGLWVPFFALLGLFSPGQKRFKFMTALFSLFFYLIAFGGNLPLHPWLFSNVPGFGLLRGPFRFVFIYQILTCLLAGLGFEYWIKRPATSKGDSRIWKAIAYLAFLWVGAFCSRWNEPVLLGLASIAGLGLVVLELFPGKPRWGLGIFFLAVLAGSLVGTWDFRSSRLGAQDALDIQKVAPYYQQVAEQIDGSRFFQGDHIPFAVETEKSVIREELPANAPCLFHLKNAGGYRPLSLLARGQLYTTPFPTFLRLMAIQGFASGNEKGMVPGFNRQAWGPVFFYTAQEPHPMVYAPRQWSVVSDSSLRLAQMGEKGFNPYELSILSEDPGKPAPLGHSNTMESVRLIEEKLDHQIFRIRLTAPSLVVFSESNFPGWKASLDGAPANLLTANHLFRGLFIPEGDHEVRFAFQPVWMRLMVFLFMIWLVMVVMFVSPISTKIHQYKNET